MQSYENSCRTRILCKLFPVKWSNEANVRKIKSNWSSCRSEMANCKTLLCLVRINSPLSFTKLQLGNVSETAYRSFVTELVVGEFAAAACAPAGVVERSCRCQFAQFVLFQVAQFEESPIVFVFEFSCTFTRHNRSEPSISNRVEFWKFRNYSFSGKRIPIFRKNEQFRKYLMKTRRTGSALRNSTRFLEKNHEKTAENKQKHGNSEWK